MSSLLYRIQVWDERAILSIIARRDLRLTRFMKAVSMMGDGYLWALLAILLYTVTSVPLHWLLVGMAAFGIELTGYKIIKQSTTRPRPFRKNPGIKNLVVPPDQYSFPSGHAAAATVAALLFSSAIPSLSPLFYTIAALIGFSRVYLGVHYPTDVLIGFALGAGSFAAANLFL